METKIYIPNLERRPDKKIATWTGLIINGYEEGIDFKFIPSHDSEKYSSLKELKEAVLVAGYKLKRLPNDFHGPQLGSIFTYLDILTEIRNSNNIGILMIDDHYLVPKQDLIQHIKKFKEKKELILNLKKVDPRTKEKQTDFYFGYRNNEDDGLLFKPEGAEKVINILLECDPIDLLLWKAIPKYLNKICLTTAEPNGLCRSIGPKEFWKSDFRTGTSKQWELLV